MGGIITRAKLSRARKEINRLRAKKHNIKPGELTALAKSLGRESRNRGKHPTYVNMLVSGRNPLSIPGHPTIKTYTAMNILDELEADIDCLWETLDEQEKQEHGKPKKLPQATLRADTDS